MLLRNRGCESKVQITITAAWCSLCIIMLLQSAKALDSHENIQLLWTYFAPVLPPLLMLWLWAQNIAFFEQYRIPFAECFPEHERRLLAPAKDLFSACRAVSCIAVAALAACAVLCSSSSSLTPLMVPPLLYGSLLVLMLMPVNVLRKSSRRFLLRTLLRVLAPLQAVSWADFLLADMLTSLAKSSSDMSRSVCLMLHGPLVHPRHPSAAAAAAACGPLTAVSLSALVLPYCLRMLQCLSIWRSGGPSSQLFNALKYASSLPALVLTALEHEYHVHHKPFPLRRIWIACMVLNSAYSFYWDVEQDWDMPWIVQYGCRKLGWLRLPGLKGNHSYSTGFYTWLLLSNLVLRFTWAHRLLGDLEAHNEVLMVVALLEVVRRWQWVYVRIETELRKLGLLLVPLEFDSSSSSSLLLKGRRSSSGGYLGHAKSMDEDGSSAHTHDQHQQQHHRHYHHHQRQHHQQQHKSPASARGKADSVGGGGAAKAQGMQGGTLAVAAPLPLILQHSPLSQEDEKEQSLLGLLPTTSGSAASSRRESFSSVLPGFAPGGSSGFWSAGWQQQHGGFRGGSSGGSSADGDAPAAVVVKAAAGEAVVLPATAVARVPKG